jgi:hypothetical protein
MEKIGKHTYRCVALPQTRWEELGDFLAESLGEPVARLVKGFNIAYPEDLLGLSSGIGLIFAALSKKMTRERAKALREFMAESLFVQAGEWQPLTMEAQEIWWAQHRGELAPVIELFLRSQFADFFEGLLGLKILKLANERSRSRRPIGQGESSPSTSDETTESDTGS